MELELGLWQDGRVEGGWGDLEDERERCPIIGRTSDEEHQCKRVGRFTTQDNEVAVEGGQLGRPAVRIGERDQVGSLPSTSLCHHISSLECCTSTSQGLIRYHYDRHVIVYVLSQPYHTRSHHHSRH